MAGSYLPLGAPTRAKRVVFHYVGTDYIATKQRDVQLSVPAVKHVLECLQPSGGDRAVRDDRLVRPADRGPAGLSMLPPRFDAADSAAMSPCASRQRGGELIRSFLRPRRAPADPRCYHHCCQRSKATSYDGTPSMDGAVPILFESALIGFRNRSVVCLRPRRILPRPSRRRAGRSRGFPHAWRRIPAHDGYASPIRARVRA